VTLLFAASEIGSWHALAPVAHSCVQSGMTVLLSQRGAAETATVGIGAALLPCGETPAQIDAFLLQHNVQAVVFSSNVSDPQPLSIARRASQKGLPTLHVLDYWNGYAQRLRLDGLPQFQPDIYAVPDKLAQTAALGEGIAGKTLRVTGQPAFADTFTAVAPNDQDKRAQKKAAGCDPDLPLMLFVSEPVTQDQGSDPTSPGYRGYTERDVIRLILSILRPLAGRLQLAALPHPREDGTMLCAQLEQGKGALATCLIRLARGRDALALADGVAGMASTLLYEAWLHGLPVASIQPGLQVSSLATLRQRQGVLFLDQHEGLQTALTAWSEGLGCGPRPRVRPEAALHSRAVDSLRDIICGLLNNNQLSQGKHS